MSTPPTLIRFTGVEKTYDGKNLVVRDLNLDIQQGEFLSMLGPSGSGKTTTLMTVTDQAAKVKRALDMVQLGAMGDHYRAQLSGGQRAGV